MPHTMKAEGWRSMRAHWHYFRNGESLCGKYTVQIIGGGEPRRPWPQTVTIAMMRSQPTCDKCLEVCS
jgi:hypothetical protein